MTIDLLIQKYPLPWSQDKVQAFRKTLLDWYDQEGRKLPWRDSHNPYYIWVSEIMLQQTQVETVKPYYHRFIEQLPTIEALAHASEEELMNLWQGLGYYSRVRNMQVAAQTIMGEFNGQMPADYQSLLSLKGIGPYTAGAIASIAFNQAHPALDGNLIRIVSRLFEIEEDVTKQSTLNMLRAYLYQLIDPDRPGDFNQALMDMGALVMTASNDRPDPHPLAEFDQSFQNHTSHKFPVKKAKKKASHHYFLAYYIRDSQGRILMRKHGDQELLHGLWHFPLVEVQMVMEGLTEDELLYPLLQHYREAELSALIDLDSLHISSSYKKAMRDGSNPLKEIKHVFSHRIWHCQLVPIQVTGNSPDIVHSQMAWIPLADIEQLAVSSLQVKLFQEVDLAG